MTEPESDRALRRHEVERLCGLATSTIYRKMRDGTFPKCIKVGDRAVRWWESEVMRWLSERPRASGINDEPPPSE